MKGMRYCADGKDVLGAETLSLVAVTSGAATMMRGKNFLSGLVSVYDALESITMLV